LATSDALKLAERVDPKGERTIGILTKLDRLELGSDARDILTGNYGIHLKRGFIGVVNRSQRDIDEKKDMKEALDKEYQFFSQHPAYKDISDRLGISYLQQYLHQELSKHIYKLLPPLKHRFELELSELTAKLEAISEPLVESDKEIILSKTNEELRKNFESAVGGNGSGNGNDVDIKKLNGGAKINVIMNDTYGNEVNQLFTDEHQMRHDIHVAIQNIKGVYMCIFPPDAAFKACVISQIGIQFEK
jgi:replication fork clamp-binding protein CrfC